MVYVEKSLSSNFSDVPKIIKGNDGARIENVFDEEILSNLSAAGEFKRFINRKSRGDETVGTLSPDVVKHASSACMFENPHKTSEKAIDGANKTHSDNMIKNLENRICTKSVISKSETVQKY